MRICLIMMLLCMSSVVAAKTKKPEPTWWCYTTRDSNNDIDTYCDRDKVACEASAQELSNTPACVGLTRAYTFTITHMNDGRVEVSAKPDLKSCRAISEQMAADSPDVIVGQCVITP